MTYPDTNRPERQYALDTLAAADNSRAEEPADRRDERRPSSAEYDALAERYRARAETMRALAVAAREQCKDRVAHALDADARHLDRIADDYAAAADGAA